jgi:hypothetical protein
LFSLSLPEQILSEMRHKASDSGRAHNGMIHTRRPSQKREDASPRHQLAALIALAHNQFGDEFSEEKDAWNTANPWLWNSGLQLQNEKSRNHF